jgi:hypothetical protein
LHRVGHGSRAASDRRLQWELSTTGPRIFSHEVIVRRIVWLSLALAGLILFAADEDAPAPTTPRPRILSSWRRAKDGWERADSWPQFESPSDTPEPAEFGADEPHPPPNPLLLALFELLASASLLMAFSPNSGPRS